jgi:hypothetical protein
LSGEESMSLRPQLRCLAVLLWAGLSCSSSEDSAKSPAGIWNCATDTDDRFACHCTKAEKTASSSTGFVGSGCAPKFGCCFAYPDRPDECDCFSQDAIGSNSSCEGYVDFNFAPGWKLVAACPAE